MVIAMKYLAFRNRCSWLSVTSCVQVAILCHSLFFWKHQITIIRPLAQRMINSIPHNASNSFDVTIFLANQKLSILTCRMFPHFEMFYVHVQVVPFEPIRQNLYLRGTNFSLPWKKWLSSFQVCSRKHWIYEKLNISPLTSMFNL